MAAVCEWGILKPIIEGKFRTMNLLKASISLGRLPSNDYVINIKEDNLSETEYFNISKTHFLLFIGDDRSFVKDISSNGTFINDRLIGKGHVVEIHNGDIIALNKKEFQAFKFFKLATI